MGQLLGNPDLIFLGYIFGYDPKDRFPAYHRRNPCSGLGD